MAVTAPEIIPMRWRDYMLIRGDAFSSFWRSHLAEQSRSLLLVLGKGFDPRTCLAIRIIAGIAGNALTEVMALEFDEGEHTPNQGLADKSIGELDRGPVACWRERTSVTQDCVSHFRWP